MILIRRAVSLTLIKIYEIHLCALYYTYNISYVYIYNFMSQFQLLQSFWILQSWHCYFYFFQRLNTDMGVILKYKSQTPILSHFGPCHFVLSEIEILLKLLNYSYDLNFVFFSRHDIHHPVRTLSQALSKLKLSTYTNRGQS